MEGGVVTWERGGAPAGGACGADRPQRGSGRGPGGVAGRQKTVGAGRSLGLDRVQAGSERDFFFLSHLQSGSGTQEMKEAGDVWAV